MKKVIKAKIKIYRDDCDLINYFKSNNIGFTHLKIKPGRVKTLHIIKLREAYNYNKIKGLTEEFNITYAKKNNTMLIYKKSCSACMAISMTDLLVLSAEPQGKESVIYTVIGEDGSIKEAINLIKKRGLRVERVGKDTYIEEELTEKQLKAILTAYTMGYFCRDRKTTLSEVAEKIGIKPSSFEDVFRRGLEKIVRYYLIDKKLLDGNSCNPCS
ncbi:MAG: helix-turn-helix domain-containing protein [Caldisphaeraceae archaeon]|nr:helix-turn-helix domain-containing protein [Caldisphaeraceae archaeon]MEB3691348.1 helix-turn-helix domain-containing protein [Caldisphaeraceae archaeon]MEB3797214.1 helix-turn-helix domain-containing protein [Caldisphaeraceae archaeon]